MTRNCRIIRLILPVCLFLLYGSLTAQVSLVSWNLCNFGRSKSDEEIAFIANTLKDYDIIGIQEVVAGNGGARAVARLADELGRKGSQWDYVVSDPTTGTPGKIERYAFIWKTASVKKIGDAWLEQQYNVEIEREPYMATFEYGGKKFTLANFHAIPKSKQPETEIKYLKFVPAEYPALDLVFFGDFNCPQSHTVFNPLRKMNYAPALVGQKTSLKMACKNGVCLANEFDNIWCNASKIKILRSAPILFYNAFETMKEARKISDHVPVAATLILN